MKNYHTKMLGKLLRWKRKLKNKTLRALTKDTGIPNPTLWRVEHDKPVDYETGKIIEEWIRK